ncbi:MAG: hypothetical protein GY796_09270 [Chloroflexi bacterium]|nr:hypothetical protein [Chloroflexota bacterium]
MNSIFGLFNLFALLYVFRGAQIVLRIGREWSQLKQEPLTRNKKKLADQASFFVAVPPSVLVHEFFHASATWLVGGRIVDFGYGVFWGYVVPVGNFSPTEKWFIAIAGTLGSLLFGTAVYLLLRHNQSSSFRFFGLRAFRFQLHFALIYYPLFTVFVPTIGDWRVIYDFDSTPVLSSLTAVAHIAALILFYQADRRGWFEMAGFETTAEQKQFAELTRQAKAAPHDGRLTMLTIDGLRRGGADHKATTRLKTYLDQNPDDAAGYALLAALQTGKNNHISSQAKENAEKALALGVTDVRHKAMAYRILGEYALERNRIQTALDQFSQAIAAISRNLANEPLQVDRQRYLADLYQRRSMAYRRQNNFDLAYQDVEKALALAKTIDDQNRANFFTQELTLIQQHAGRPLGKTVEFMSDESG